MVDLRERVGVGAAAESRSRRSVARGLTLVAFSCVAVVVVRACPDTGFNRDRVVPTCATPVELRTAEGSFLACAETGTGWGCQAIVAGDRVAVDDLACRRDPGGMAAPMRLLAGVPLDVNRASAADLELLDGIGPVLARAIISDRQARGPFPSPDDLVRVKGIGPATLQRIRPQIDAGQSSERQAPRDWVAPSP